MIQLEFLKGPDEDMLGKFKFFQNQLFLGKSGCNLNLNDPLLQDPHLMIEVIERDLIIHPQRNTGHYLINGKRATTIRKLKKMDVILVGNTEFRLLDYALTETHERKEILENKMSRLIRENSPRLNVIEKLGELSK